MIDITKIGIILIDDTFIDRTIVRKNMELFYPEVPFEAYASGGEALEAIEQGKTLPDVLHRVILLDIYMPEMNGFAFADLFDALDEAIKKDYTIFMLSSSIDAGDMENVEKRKVIRKFISKPLNEAILKTVLDETIQTVSNRAH